MKDFEGFHLNIQSSQIKMSNFNVFITVLCHKAVVHICEVKEKVHSA